MIKEIKQRLRWVELNEKTNDAGLVCRRCGISRPTIRKWYKRYRENGVDGLQDVSRCPHSSPNTKINNQIEKWILDLRKDRKRGARRIQYELLREHNFQLSLASTHKVLTKHEVKPIVFQRNKKDFIRYQRPIPSDRIQMDTCKIAPGIYQYTAIDDWSRYRVFKLIAERSFLLKRYSSNWWSMALNFAPTNQASSLKWQRWEVTKNRQRRVLFYR